MTFIDNPFRDVDIINLSGLMAELFSIVPLEMEIEVINVQNDVHLKSQQCSQHFWDFIVPDNYKKNSSPGCPENGCYVGADISG